MGSDQGSNPQPRYVPWQGIKPATLWCTGQCSTNQGIPGFSWKTKNCGNIGPVSLHSGCSWSQIAVAPLGVYSSFCCRLHHSRIVPSSQVTCLAPAGFWVWDPGLCTWDHQCSSWSWFSPPSCPSGCPLGRVHGLEDCELPHRSLQGKS